MFGFGFVSVFGFVLNVIAKSSAGYPYSRINDTEALLYVFQKERRQEIYSIIREQKKVKVAQLAERFNVTLETIRSDLKYLENEGLIKRCHGGAILGKQEIKKDQ